MDTRTENYLILLQGVDAAPRDIGDVSEYPTIEELESFWPDSSEVLALDFETKGIDIFDKDFQVLGLGISFSLGSFYINLRDSKEELKMWLTEKLLQHKLIAFNVVFDGMILQHWTGQYYWDNWIACCYGLFRQLATEGYAGQSWSLEEAENKLLRWPQSNKDALKDWLVSNGHTLKNSDSADKSKMYLAPFDIISTYCSLDADACWQLYFKVFLPFFEKFPFLKIYHERYFMTAIKLAVEQYMYGSLIDVEKLTKYDQDLLVRIEESQTKFFNHPDILPYIKEYNKKISDVIRSRPPKQFKKSGKLTKGYIKWLDKLEEIEKINHFNLNSDPQLRWLFYEKLNMPVTLTTDKGAASVSSKVLPNFGDPGKILIEYNELVKMQGFTKAALEEVRDGLMHVRVRPGSTITGRATSGERTE